MKNGNQKSKALNKQEKLARLQLAKQARYHILRGETVIINAKIVYGSIHTSGGMIVNTEVIGAQGSAFMAVSK